MPNSVNTNVGALVALQNLNITNSELATTQSRINTGLKIANAKDNGAIWAIAQNQRSTSQSLNAVRESLQRGQSVVEVSISAGESISDLLLQMKEKALAAADAGLNTVSRNALNNEYVSLRTQIAKAVANADFNGANLIKAGGTAVQALANANASSRITVAAQALTLTALGLTTSSISTQALASAAIALVNTAVTSVSSRLSKLGTGAKSLSTHLRFIDKLQDTIDAGIGNLVDADLAKESARLQALQTKQQLGIQALSIANQSSSILLGLFRSGRHTAAAPNGAVVADVRRRAGGSSSRPPLAHSWSAALQRQETWIPRSRPSRPRQIRPSARLRPPPASPRASLQPPSSPARIPWTCDWSLKRIKSAARLSTRP